MVNTKIYNLVFLCNELGFKKFDFKTKINFKTNIEGPNQYGGTMSKSK